jgi:hypothetical protein
MMLTKSSKEALINGVFTLCLRQAHPINPLKKSFFPKLHIVISACCMMQDNPKGTFSTDCYTRLMYALIHFTPPGTRISWQKAKILITQRFPR